MNNQPKMKTRLFLIIFIIISCNSVQEYSGDGVEVKINKERKIRNVFNYIFFEATIHNKLTKNIYIEDFIGIIPVLYHDKIINKIKLNFFSGFLLNTDSLKLDCIAKRDTTYFAQLKQDSLKIDYSNLPSIFEKEYVMSQFEMYYATRLYLRAKDSIKFCIPLDTTLLSKGNYEIVLEYPKGSNENLFFDTVRDSLNINIDTVYNGYRRWTGRFRSNVLNFEKKIEPETYESVKEFYKNK